MKNINRVFLMGRLGSQPMLRETKSGVPVAHFSIATHSGGDDTEKTEWHRVVTWGKQAQFCAEHLVKGQRVHVDGTIRSRRYENPEGVERTSYEIHADEVIFLDRARASSKGASDTPLTPTSDRPEIPEPVSLQDAPPRLELGA